MDQNSESGDVRTGVATYVVDAAVAAILLAIGLTVTITSWKLGAGWTSDGPGSGYFPFGIGVLICISSIGTLVQALFGKEKNTEVFVDGEQFGRVLKVFVPSVIYVGAIEVVGVYGETWKTFRCRDTVLTQYFFSLILVDIHDCPY